MKNLIRRKVTLSNVRYKQIVPWYCCPYCVKPVGLLGHIWAAWLGVWVHGCDYSNIDLPPKTIRFLRGL